MLQSAGRYLRKHPQEIPRALRNALGWRVGLPLDAFRWLADELLRPSEPIELAIETRAPGLFVAGNLRVAKTLLRASADVFVDRVVVDEEQIRFELRVESLQLEPMGEHKTPVSALLRSKVLDLSRPGDLIQQLPDLPEMIVESHDNRVVLDLRKAKAVVEDPRVQKLVAYLSALLTVDGIESEDDHLDLRIRPIPRGIRSALGAIDALAVTPARERLREELAQRVPGLRRDLRAKVHRLRAALGAESEGAGEDPDPSKMP